MTAASRQVLDLYTSSLAEQALRALGVLAIGLELRAVEFRQAIADLGIVGAESSVEVEQEIRALSVTRSFGSRLAVAAPVAAEVSSWLRETRHEVYLAIHSYFARRELAAATSSDSFDSWSARARLAYFIAPDRPEESSEEFSILFDSAPVDDRTLRRLWLADLVSRQSEEFGEQSRTVAFYRGFQRYVAGDRKSAKALFDEVLASGETDRYAAVAGHLAAVCIRNSRADGVRELLEVSVARSQELGLLANEVMARNSLVWVLLSQAKSRANRSVDIERALAESRQNVATVRERWGETFGMRSWVLRTLGHVEWEYARISESDPKRLSMFADEALGILQTAAEESSLDGERGNLIHVLSDRVNILVSERRVSEAVAEAKAMGEVIRMSYSPDRTWVMMTRQWVSRVRALTAIGTQDRAAMERILGSLPQTKPVQRKK